MSSEYFANCIKNNIPFFYCKFGDGEYLCMYKYKSNDKSLICNCDSDNYTEYLSLSLCKSLHYIVNNVKNYYIGEWYQENVKKFFLSIAGKSIKYNSYHSFLFDESDLKNNVIRHKLNILKEIKNSKRKKIYICNNLLIKSKILLNIDNFIFVSLNNWFDKDYDIILGQIKTLLTGENDDSIIMTSCGMGAKVLLSDLYKQYPNCTYIDIGSGLDIICTKRNSRGWGYKYEQLYNKFLENDFIPDEWNDPKYNYIYPIAHNKLGIHVSKDI
jgi:hypothetical protein